MSSPIIENIVGHHERIRFLKVRFNTIGEKGVDRKRGNERILIFFLTFYLCLVCHQQGFILSLLKRDRVRIILEYVLNEA